MPIEDIANKPGKYPNFSGLIIWKESYANVHNANFELNDSGIIFNNGIWLNRNLGKWNLE